MTVGLSTTNLVNKWLDVISGTTFTGVASPSCQLHTGDPGASGTANVSVGSSAKNALTWNAAAAGSKSLASAPSAWTNGGTSETLSHVSVWLGGTTFGFSAALTTPQAWASGNTFTLTALSISVAPLAA